MEVAIEKAATLTELCTKGHRVSTPPHKIDGKAILYTLVHLDFHDTAQAPNTRVHLDDVLVALGLCDAGAKEIDNGVCKYVRHCRDDGHMGDRIGKVLTRMGRGGTSPYSKQSI